MNLIKISFENEEKKVSTRYEKACESQQLSNLLIKKKNILQQFISSKIHKIVNNICYLRFTERNHFYRTIANFTVEKRYFNVLLSKSQEKEMSWVLFVISGINLTDKQTSIQFQLQKKPMFQQKPLRHQSTLQAGKERENLISHISLAQKYYINSLISQNQDYNIYKGVDAEKYKWVHLYAKRFQHNFEFSGKIKEHLRVQLCPKVVWAGQLLLLKTNYYFQVHERLGPSLRTVFEYKKEAPSEKQLLHLLYQMIRLVQKMNNVNLVCGQFSPDLIIFDANPQKNDLYLLNCFRLKKKKKFFKPLSTKYSSRGALLGRSITTKDDLESVCYILIDIFSKGEFYKGKRPSELQQAKLSMNIENFSQGLTQILVDFYRYVISLNYQDEINFSYWKNTLFRVLTAEVMGKPFGFLLKKENNKEIVASKWNSSLKDSEKSTQTDQIKEYEEWENTVRLKKIDKHSLQY